MKEGLKNSWRKDRRERERQRERENEKLRNKQDKLS